jgi:hypothetical protein
MIAAKIGNLLMFACLVVILLAAISAAAPSSKVSIGAYIPGMNSICIVNLGVNFTGYVYFVDTLNEDLDACLINEVPVNIPAGSSKLVMAPASFGPGWKVEISSEKRRLNFVNVTNFLGAYNQIFNTDASPFFKYPS